MKPPKQGHQQIRSILLVEDDPMIASGLRYALESEGYQVTHSETIALAKDYLVRDRFDLAILDMQLPDGAGIEIHDVLQVQDAKTAVIFLTVIDDEDMIVQRLDSGAADYITKPFRFRELLARIKKALAAKPREHTSSSQASALKDIEKISINELTIDIASGRVYLRGNQIDLTKLEYRLLLTLLSRRGRLLTREHLLDVVWEGSASFIEDNTLSASIARVRKKVDGEIDIETVRGLGYRVN